MKDWELIEHTVMLLEQALTPNSIVKRDVKLKDLTSNKGLERQCDVVIWTGTHPRETITIVEVQDRTKAVDINTFQGWIQKMRDVGAQHLICVSRHEFPESIKDKVFASGNTIRLMTLKELDSSALPNDFFGVSCTFNYPEYSSIQITKANVKGNNRGHLQFKTDEEIFYLNNKKKASSFMDINNQITQGIEIPKTITSLAIVFPLDKNRLWVNHNGKFIEFANFEYTLTIIHKQLEVPITTYSYEQDKSGTLVWMLEAKAEVLQDKVNIKIPVHKSPDGEHYEIRALSLLGNTSGMNLTMVKISNNEDDV